MLGNRDSEAGSRQPIWKPAVRYPLSDFAFRFFKLFEQITGYLYSGNWEIGNRVWGLGIFKSFSPAYE